MLNNEHIKAIDVDIALLVSFVIKGLQPRAALEDIEYTDNVQQLLAGKYLSNHLLFAVDYHGWLPFSSVFLFFPTQRC
jgi:hypothetical protein